MAKRYKIIPATKDHQEQIKYIYKECKSELGSFNLYQCWEKYLSGESNEKFDVAIVQGPHSYMVIGFVRWNWSKKYSNYLLKDIGVLSTFRGNKAGVALLKHVPTPVMLKCNVSNKNGNAFYESMKMVKAGVTHTKAGVPQNIWVCAEW